MSKSTNYNNLSEELQALVHQLIIIESQKGPHPLSGSQISNIVDNIYGVMLGATPDDQKPEVNATDEDLVKAHVAELQKLHPSAEIITSEMEMYDLKGTEFDKAEFWQYSGIALSKEGLTYTIFTSLQQKNTWAIRRDGKALFIGLDKGLGSVPFEALAEIFKQYAK